MIVRRVGEANSFKKPSTLLINNHSLIRRYMIKDIDSVVNPPPL
jgi:hypothetical protein